jgi:hypothetical protein
MNIDPLCNAVMRGVVATGVMRDREDRIAPAVTIMREELKALLAVGGDDQAARYADARDAVMRGAIHDGYVIGLVVANCVERIAEVAP